MKKDHKEELADLVKAHLGEDLDADFIDEVAKHMEECPNCRICYDSVRQTVKLYRVTESESSLPNQVSERLFKVLSIKPH
jgi:predicted anti-sigma-YlaC factor YlaD